MKVSIIIPVRVATACLKETIQHLQRQSFKDFEIIVIPDEKEKISGAIVLPSHNPGPAFKRNLGVQKAKGEILAFLDDDSYPDKDWLKNAIEIFNNVSLNINHQIVGVCGPA